MIRFVVRRLLLSIPVVLGVVTVVFIVSRMFGDPCAAALGEHANPQSCARFNEHFGLYRPVLPFVANDRNGLHLISDPGSIVDNQYVHYIGDILHGELGDSIRNGLPVTQILVNNMPTTIELTLYALTFAIVVGMSLGIIAAYRRNSPADMGTMMLANLGVSIPVFVLGLTFAFAFGVLLKDSPLALPPSGRLTAGLHFKTIAEAWGLQTLAGPPRTALDFVSNMYTINGLLTGQFFLFFDAIRHLLLPAVALGTIPMAIIARMTRSSLLEVLGQDYVRTARAKGVGQRRILFRHGLRNALLPVVTVIGLSVAGLLSGAVLTETVFGLTGIGQVFYDSIIGTDYIVIQGLTLLIAIIYVLTNLVVDVSYAFLDPRVRL